MFSPGFCQQNEITNTTNGQQFFEKPTFWFSSPFLLLFFLASKLQSLVVVVGITQMACLKSD